MIDLNHLSAAEAARKIAAGQLKSEDIVHACLERIAKREPEVQAWAHLVDSITAGVRMAGTRYAPS